MIFPLQIRAARALLGWNQNELAHAASIGIATLRRLEVSDTQLRGSAEVIWKIQVALEKAGVEFIPEDDLKGPGVRLKESTRSKAGRKRKSRGG
jgi:transcriptional regulator with XRE-family HTH domain